MAEAGELDTMAAAVGADHPIGPKHRCPQGVPGAVHPHIGDLAADVPAHHRLEGDEVVDLDGVVDTGGDVQQITVSPAPQGAR